MRVRWPSVLVLLGLGACQHSPMDYIPESDRSLLQAQARLGEGSAAAPVSVDAMLAKARAAQPAIRPTGGPRRLPAPLALQFTDSVVGLSGQQKQSLAAFAADIQGHSVLVVSRPGGAAPLLGQRRALLVADALGPANADIQVRFSTDVPADVVVVRVQAGAETRTNP